MSDKMTVLGAEGLRLPQSLRSFAMTLVGYLKKQSQFASGQIGVNSYLEGYYGNIAACRAPKNKANRRAFEIFFGILLIKSSSTRSAPESSKVSWTTRQRDLSLPQE